MSMVKRHPSTRMVNHSLEERKPFLGVKLQMRRSFTMRAPISRRMTGIAVRSALVTLLAAAPPARADTSTPARTAGAATAAAGGDGGARHTINVDGVAFDVTARAQPRRKQYALSLTIDARSVDGREHFMAGDPIQVSTFRECRNRDGTGSGSARIGDIVVGTDGWDRATRITADDSAHWAPAIAERAGHGCQIEVTISIAAFTFANGRSERLRLASVRLDVQSKPRITIEDETPQK
jgi:hypothetical protein